MEGTSARGQKTFLRPPLGNSAPAVSRVGDLGVVQRDLVQWLGEELAAFETFVILVHPVSGELAFEELKSSAATGGVSSAWLKSHLERHPTLKQKLCHGELVGISRKDATATPRPVEAVRASVVLIPVLADQRLLGVFGILSWLEGPQPTTDDMETLRSCAAQAAPFVSMALELNRLRLQTDDLQATLERYQAGEKAALLQADRNTQLEAASQMRSHLYSNVAHELRTPLASVRGYARMVLDGRSGDINPRQREYLGVIVENSNRMIHLINWMSEIFDASEQQMRLEEIDLHDVWTDCVQEFEPEFSRGALTLRDETPNETFGAFADKERIATVFRQMLRGVVHFSAPGADIGVRFSHGREHETTLKIYGISREISPEWSSRERMTQNRGSNGENNFSSIYDIVGMHGGRFFVRRTPEEGSVLLITLPAIRSELHQGSGKP